MKLFFTSKGMEELQKVVHENCLFGFDYDGTLSKIVEQPQKAKLSKSIIAELQKLQKNHKVLILSGRSLIDLRQRFPLKNVILVGNHGLEGLYDFREYKKLMKSWEKRITPYLSPECRLENKGYSLTVHYRGAKNTKKRQQSIKHMGRKIIPEAKLSTGKCVVNFLPPVDFHKGKAFMALMKKGGFKKGFFIGDDVTDEDVFRVKSKNTLTIRVGYSKNSKAKYYIKSQKDVLRVLRLINKVGLSRTTNYEKDQ